MKRYLCAAVICCAGNPALAGEVDAGWSGFYAGLTGGYSAIEQNRVIHQTAPPLEIKGSFDFDEMLAGIVGGYNFQQGQLVLGIEGAFLLAPQGRSLVTGEPGVTSGAYADQNWQAEALVRAGYDAGAFMPFVAAGAALSSFDTALFSGSPAVEIGQSGETHWGLTAGAGVEMQATEHARLKLEYRYSQFFEQNYAFDTPGVYDQGNEFGSHAIRASVIMNF